MRPRQAAAGTSLSSPPTDSSPFRCKRKLWPPFCCSAGIFFLGGCAVGVGCRARPARRPLRLGLAAALSPTTPVPLLDGKTFKAKRNMLKKRRKSIILANGEETPMSLQFWRAAKPSRLGKSRKWEKDFPLGSTTKSWSSGWEHGLLSDRYRRYAPVTAIVIIDKEQQRTGRAPVPLPSAPSKIIPTKPPCIYTPACLCVAWPHSSFGSHCRTRSIFKIMHDRDNLGFPHLSLALESKPLSHLHLH